MHGLDTEYYRYAAELYGCYDVSQLEFIALLKQANVDSQELSKVAGIPEAQLQYVSNCASGMGIL